MNNAKFIKRLEELHMGAVEISKKKNADYASDADPFSNFRACELYGVSSNKGILVRMSDKMMRIANLLERDAKVEDESILDTLQDLSNYALILAIKIEDEKN